MAQLLDIPVATMPEFWSSIQSIGINPMLIDGHHENSALASTNALSQISPGASSVDVKLEDVYSATGPISPLSLPMASHSYPNVLPQYSPIPPLPLSSPVTPSQSERDSFTTEMLQEGFLAHTWSLRQPINPRFQERSSAVIPTDIVLPSLSTTVPQLWSTSSTPVSPGSAEHVWPVLPALTPDLGSCDSLVMATETAMLGNHAMPVTTIPRSSFVDTHGPSGYDSYSSSGPMFSSSFSEPCLLPDPVRAPPIEVKNPKSSRQYNVSLNVRTAYIRSDEIAPLTYLNKYELYRISVCHQGLESAGYRPFFDSPFGPPAEQVPIYRSCVRVTFDEAGNRANPEAFWKLFRESRTDQKEPVNALQFVLADPPVRAHAELERLWSDGFAVRWHPTVPQLRPTCSIPFKFKFLSTDFSRSKGVKGIVVRLCVKTQLIGYMDRTLASTKRHPSGLSDSQRNHPPLVTSFTDHTLFKQQNVPGGTRIGTGLGAEAEDDETPRFLQSEMYHCRVRIFRDHGAERKVSNDKKQVERWISKATEMLTQIGRKEIENGMMRGKKRKCEDIIDLEAMARLSTPTSGTTHYRSVRRRSSACSNKGRTGIRESDSSDSGAPVVGLLAHWGPPKKKIDSKEELFDQVKTYEMMLNSRNEETLFTYHSPKSDDPELNPLQYDVLRPENDFRHQVNGEVDDDDQSGPDPGLSQVRTFPSRAVRTSQRGNLVDIKIQAVSSEIVNTAALASTVPKYKMSSSVPAFRGNCRRTGDYSIGLEHNVSGPLSTDREGSFRSGPAVGGSIGGSPSAKLINSGVEMPFPGISFYSGPARSQKEGVGGGVVPPAPVAAKPTSASTMIPPIMVVGSGRGVSVPQPHLPTPAPRITAVTATASTSTYPHPSQLIRRPQLPQTQPHHTLPALSSSLSSDATDPFDSFGFVDHTSSPCMFSSQEDYPDGDTGREFCAGGFHKAGRDVKANVDISPLNGCE